jgi:hypothetical protein
MLPLRTWAYFPQSKKTTPLQRLLMTLRTASVTFVQPMSAWLCALCALTVSTALSSKTPADMSGEGGDGAG